MLEESIKNPPTPNNSSPPKWIDEYRIPKKILMEIV